MTVIDREMRDTTGLRKGAVALLGMGTAVPEGISQKEAAAISEGFACGTDGQRAWLQRVFLRSGVENRGSVLLSEEDGIRTFYQNREIIGESGPTTAARMERYAREAPILGEKAARAAMEEAHMEAASITHLVTVSCTGFSAPGLDVELINRLGLPANVRRMHLGFMGCHAGFNALGAAQDAVRANPQAKVLVCSVELSSLHFSYGWRPEKLVANALFADGASACVVGSSSEDGSGCELLETASLLLPNSLDAMTWKIGNNGFEMTLSAELPALIGTHIRSWCEGWLGKLGLTIDDIDLWAIHPGGPRILNAAREALGLREEDLRVSFDVLARHGNMSSATVLFLLQKLAREKKSGLCVAIGFGPGLMAEGMLVAM